jgi:hypothetical protein
MSCQWEPEWAQDWERGKGNVNRVTRERKGGRGAVLDVFK